MTVINKTVREKMADKLVKEAYETKVTEARDKLGEIFLMVYNTTYSPEIQKLIQQIPKDMRASTKSVALYGTNVEYALYCTHSETLPILCNFPSYFYVTRINEALSKEDTAKALTLVKSYEQVIQERDNFREEMLGIIQGARTYKKLWELWPESYELLKEFVPITQGQYLPALPTQRLNKLLGLPKEGSNAS